VGALSHAPKPRLAEISKSIEPRSISLHFIQAAVSSSPL
jgi:hypothetical protein